MQDAMAEASPLCLTASSRAHAEIIRYPTDIWTSAAPRCGTVSWTLIHKLQQSDSGLAPGCRIKMRMLPYRNAYTSGILYVSSY